MVLAAAEAVVGGPVGAGAPLQVATHHNRIKNRDPVSLGPTGRGGWAGRGRG